MSSTITTQEPIPLVYRVLFTQIDPFFCMRGFIQHLFAPIPTLQGYSPSALTTPRIETVHLLDSMAGFFITLGFLEAILLRVRAKDVAVWRTVQGCVALLDAVMVYAALKALSAEGRMNTKVWRGDDWRLVAGNAGIGLFRIACALGIGIRGSVKPKRI